MSRDVAILGCGPAGLLAAHAATQSGCKPVIYSLIQPSKIFGAQYLHRAIPGITEEDPDMIIDVAKSGSREGYARLVYGYPQADVSWDRFQPEQIPAWNLRTAYDTLWTMYGPNIIHRDLDFGSVAASKELAAYDTIFSSVPMPVLCGDDTHKFRDQPIEVLVQPPDPDDWNPDYHVMLYNGFPPDGSVGGTIGYPWYRFSKINGWSCWEYAQYHPDPDESLGWAGRYIMKGKKPLHTNCDCAAVLSITPIGRWGKWKRGELTHHAYEDVLNALQ